MLVKVYEASMEMPNTVLIGRLSDCVKVLSFRRDCVATGVYNGVRTARMHLSKPIPSTMRIVGKQVMVFQTSRHCGKEGHMANGCKAPCCFNWEGPGHRTEDCPKPNICNVSFSVEHFTSRCPFIIYSANLHPRIEGQGTASYATAVQDRPLQGIVQRRAKPQVGKKQEVQKPEETTKPEEREK